MNRKKQAYIIPYVISGDGKISCLLAQKQVISFDALLTRLEWESLRECILNKVNPIGCSGKVKGMETRFKGVLLPAGGKLCWYGGSGCSGESERQTAIRELKEELPLGWKVSEKDLEKISFRKSSYYGLNVTNYNLESEVLEKLNKFLQKFNGETSIADCLMELKKKDSKVKLPEIHHVELLEISEIIKRFDKPEDWRPFIEHEILRFTDYVFQMLELSKTEKSDEHKQFNKYIIDYWMSDEYVDWNKDAVKKLHEDLKKQVARVRKVGAEAEAEAEA